MTNKNTVVPAFPMQYADDSWQSGMSLRDYFAAKAMQGIVSNNTAMASLGKAANRELVDPDSMLSSAAYGIADAMLQERAK